MAMTGGKTSRRALPAAVWAMGLGSMFMDTSSELIHALLPLFLAGTLGASMLTIGLIEGVAEATAAVTRVFSGTLSDRLGRRKPLVIFGYGLAAFTKPVFAAATSVGWVFGARWVDRLGKGIRGAPRDALLADLVAPPLRGAAYGLRQALDSVGAFAGPLLAIAALAWFADDLRSAMWVAVPPAFLAVAVLWRYVREPETAATQAAERPPLALASARRLPARFWQVVALGAVFTLARFSEAFLVLRAQDAGLTLTLVPLVMVAMNLVYSASAYPFGRLADRVDRRLMLAAGLLVLVAADLVMAWAAGWALLLGGVALWGVHMGLTQGLLGAMVADSAPEHLRGTAFGLFNLASGLAMLLASALAGLLWTALGPAATFLAGAGFALSALLALAGLVLLRRRAG